MRAILVFVVSSLFPVVTFAQPLTPEEQLELELLEEELALRQAMRDTPVESMNAPAWCFQYRNGREFCTDNVLLAEVMLPIARHRAAAAREGDAQAAAWFAEIFERARAEGVRGWCERLRQDAFDYGGTRQLSCRPVNEVFVITSQFQCEGETSSFRVRRVYSNFREAWGLIQRMTERNISESNCLNSNIRIRKLVYTP